MDDTAAHNIQPVSYKKILPKYEVWPTDEVDYIDLQYDPAAFKLPHSESQSKFNSLPNIKSGRKSRYISAIEAISLPKCEAKENLAIESSERETDNVSKLSDTTTVLIHESPRGIANDAFEDDEDVLDSNKRCNTASPSQSNVSYSSNDSSVKIPIPEISAAAKKKQMESEGYQNSMIDTKLKKNWRGEKLYISIHRGRDQHLKRFIWWMICLLLLAGAITVAGLIGVGVIKLPAQSSTRLQTITERTDHIEPRMGFVGSFEAGYQPEVLLITTEEDSATASTTTSTTTTTTTTTRSTTTTTMTTSTSTRMHVIAVEGSGQSEIIDISENDFGSGMEISDTSEEKVEDELKVDFFDEGLMPEKMNEKVENEKINENLKDNETSELNNELDGSGEVELIITLPDLSREGDGLAQSQGGDFEITRKKKGFQTGEDVFKALVHFLLPNSEEASLESDDKSFKDLFNIFAS